MEKLKKLLVLLGQAIGLVGQMITLNSKIHQ
jgi:hypothetical protein